MSKTVLVTGSSSGFGRFIVKKFHSEGWNVVATMRSPDKETDLTNLEKVLVTRLDVTDTASIQDAVKAAEAKFGGIDALVNNAGYGGHALVEQADDSYARRMFDTNFFGATAVARAVLPAMRQKGEGAIVNVTSVAGHIAGPLNSTYSATKFALEAWTEAAAIELSPLGIKVHAVGPGAFGTNFSGARDDNVDAGDAQLVQHAKAIELKLDALISNMSAEGTHGQLDLVAEKIFDCVTKDMPIHNVVGADAENIIGLKNSMPHQEFLDQLVNMLNNAG